MRTHFLASAIIVVCQATHASERPNFTQAVAARNIVHGLTQQSRLTATERIQAIEQYRPTFAAAFTTNFASQGPFLRQQISALGDLTIVEPRLFESRLIDRTLALRDEIYRIVDATPSTSARIAAINSSLAQRAELVSAFRRCFSAVLARKIPTTDQSTAIALKHPLPQPILRHFVHQEQLRSCIQSTTATDRIRIIDAADVTGTANPPRSESSSSLEK